MKIFFINLQFQPISHSVKELTPKEYSDLFEELITAKGSSSLGKHKFITFDITTKSISEEFVKGKLLIYKKPPSYKDIQTDKVTTIPKANEVEFSKRSKFYFYLPKHILIIQKKSSELDNPTNIENKIKKLIMDKYNTVKDKNPKYYNYALSFTIISKKEDLEKVINLHNVKSIEIDLTFPNSDDLEDALEDELKDKKTHRLTHTEKAYDGSYMNGVTDYAKTLSHIALKLGNVVMRYIDDETKKVKKYVMKNKIIEREISKKYKDENLFEEDYVRGEVISVLDEIKEKK